MKNLKILVWCLVLQSRVSFTNCENINSDSEMIVTVQTILVQTFLSFSLQSRSFNKSFVIFITYSVQYVFYFKLMVWISYSNQFQLVKYYNTQKIFLFSFSHPTCLTVGKQGTLIRTIINKKQIPSTINYIHAAKY